MTYSICIILKKALAILKDEFKPGEELLWHGGQTQNPRMKKYVRNCIWIIALLALLVVTIGIEGIVKRPVIPILAVFSLMLMLRAIYRTGQISKNLLFALSSQRAFVVTTYKKVRIDSYPKEKLGNYSKVYYDDGSGDIIFQNIDVRPGYKVSFNRIHDVKNVIGILDTLIQPPVAPAQPAG